MPSPEPLSRRRPTAPTSIALPAPAAIQMEDIAPDEMAPALPRNTGTFGFVPVRAIPLRLRSNMSHTSHASTGSRHSNHYTPTRWAGAATSPGVTVSPAAVDYFNQVTADRHSWRALQNLGLVAVGRCLLTLGLAGVLEAYVPGAITHTAGGKPTCMPPPRPGFAVDYHPAIFGLGIAGTVIGFCAHTWGIARFYNDTRAINERRANVVASIAMLGATLVTTGGTFYLYGILDQRDKVLWEALPLRAIGNFCVFGAIPNSFSASEIVWGDIPVRNRLILRDLFFALGGMMLMTWAQISTPDPPAPLWAREVTQCLGIICIAIGGALPRVDGQRAAADLRELERRRASIANL